MAVPHEEAGDVEVRLDSGKAAGIHEDGILGPGFPCFRRNGAAAKLRSSVRADLDRLPVDHLELHLVDVDGMGILGEVVDLPHFCYSSIGSENGVLRDSLHPLLRGRGDDTLAAHGRYTEQTLGRTEGNLRAR